MRHQTFGATVKTETEREKRNRSLARRVEAEGIVMLENSGVLPLPPGKIALYGTGSRMTVKGGSGSGDVRERYSVTIEQGLMNAGFTFPTTLWMDRFEEKYRREIKAWKDEVEDAVKSFGPLSTMKMFTVISSHPRPCPQVTPVLSDEITDATDTAVYVISRQAGEGRDRRVERGDYLLSDTEEENIRLLRKSYEKLILVINSGGIIDLSILDSVFVDALLLMGQGGEEGGNALADIITGKVNPSGRLTDTWAYSYSDYPSADSFSYMNGTPLEEEYSEGIYVGYRHFERYSIKPRYPFGCGLSYTSFEEKAVEVTPSRVTVRVTNTGRVAGKEAVLVFVSKPGEDGEKRSLAAFDKTEILPPGESATLTVPVNLRYISSYSEEREAFVLDKGEYSVAVNDSPSGSFILEKEIVYKREHHTLPAFSEKVTRILSRLSRRDKIELVTGGGYAMRCYNNVMGAAGRTCTKLLKKGIPNIVLSDGPAGINIVPVITTTKGGSPRYPEGLPEDWNWGWIRKFGPLIRRLPGTRSGRTVYRYMTAWPSATVEAQTWNAKLLEEVGRAVGEEMLETGVSVWLAPGLNIHRNPLCGRSFEYYSEDPVLSGRMAAAVTRGVQSMGGVVVCQKHYLCNNREDNRTEVSADVSERALREIYLRAFEIAVREGKPGSVMTSYNRVNGEYVNTSRRFCTEILRDEWGFEGLVMSDWNATDRSSHSGAVNAGNDLLMPGNRWIRKKLEEDLESGKLKREALDISAGRVLTLIFNSDASKEFR